MKFKLVNINLNELFQAICRTFFHSLWQGLILILFALVTIRLTKGSRPALRYNLLTTLFGLFMIVVGFTFITQYSLLVSRGQFEYHHKPVHTLNFIAAGSSASIFSKLIAFLDNNANLFFIIWFIFFVFKLTQLFNDFRYIHRVKRQDNFIPPKFWSVKVAELSALLQIKKQVTMLESHLAKVSFTVGYLKPVILVPAGLLANLPPEQVEMILLHELAHIRRNDYLVNMLQSIVETIFFFNPAVIWLASRIREEREKCCDDIALGASGDKATYIRAILSFQNHKPEINTVMAFPGTGSRFLNRMRHIIDGPGRGVNFAEKSFYIFGAMLICFMLLSVDISSKLFPQQPVAHTKLEKRATTHKSKATKTILAKRQPVKGRLNLSVAKAKREDTILVNESPEYLAGYRAGYNYSKEQSLQARMDSIRNVKSQISDVFDNVLSTTAIMEGKISTERKMQARAEPLPTFAPEAKMKMAKPQMDSVETASLVTQQRAIDKMRKETQMKWLEEERKKSFQ